MEVNVRSGVLLEPRHGRRVLETQKVQWCRSTHSYGVVGLVLRPGVPLGFTEQGIAYEHCQSNDFGRVAGDTCVGAGGNHQVRLATA